MGLRFLEFNKRLTQHQIALGDARLHGLEQIEHSAQTAIQPLGVDQDKVLSNRVLQLPGDLLGRILQAGIQADHQRCRIHHLLHRVTAAQIATEALHKDVLQGGATDQAQRPAGAIYNGQREKSFELRRQQTIRHISDAHVCSQRRNRLEQARERAGSGHGQTPCALESRHSTSAKLPPCDSHHI